MKLTIYFITALVIFSACGGEEAAESQIIKTSFDGPFPKRPKNLTLIFGDRFSILNKDDTLNFKVEFEKESRINTITNVDLNYILFKGTACKYKGLYYLNTQVDDTTYWMHAIKLTKGGVKGLLTETYQMEALDSKYAPLLLLSEEDSKSIIDPLLKYINPDQDIIKLNPDKKALRLFYDTLLQGHITNSIINKTFKADTSTSSIEEFVAFIENEENQIIEKIYPNPASEHINVIFKMKGEFQYSIYNMEGNKIAWGEINLGDDNDIDTSIPYKISLEDFKPAIYILKVFQESDTMKTESVRFVVE